MSAVITTLLQGAVLLATLNQTVTNGKLGLILRTSNIPYSC